MKTNEIGRLELGLQYHNLEKKSSGFFHGSNVAEDLKILRRETGASYVDIRTSSVARRERWKQLMKQYFGKIDAEIGKNMLGDHYDVYLGREQGSSRTLCGHSELDDGMVPGSSARSGPPARWTAKSLPPAWPKKCSSGQSGEAHAGRGSSTPMNFSQNIPSMIG